MTRLRHLTSTFAVIVKWGLNRFITGLMSSGAACPAPPAADENQLVGGWTTAAFRSYLNGAELVVSIPSEREKKKIRISGKHFKKNSGAEITRENTMTVRVLFAGFAIQSSSLYVDTTLFGLFPSCTHLSF